MELMEKMEIVVNMEKDTINEKQLSKKQKKHYISAKELLEMKITYPEWIIENIVREQNITIIAGKYESFKSFFALYAAVCVALGKEVLDTLKTKKLRVLIVDEENRIERLIIRLTKLLRGMDIDITDLDLYFMISEGVVIDKKELYKETYPDETQIQIEDKTTGRIKVVKKRIQIIKTKQKILGHVGLEQIIDELRPALIIFDSTIRVMEGNENFASDVRIVYTVLKNWILKYKTAFILLQHTTKGTKRKNIDDVRGSGDFAGFADNVIMINRWRTKTKELDNEFFLSGGKYRDKRMKLGIRFVVEDTDNGGVRIISLETSHDETTKLEKKTRPEMAADDIVNWTSDKQVKDFRTGDVQKEFNGKHSKSSITTALKLLNEREIIKLVATGIWEVVR